jgi:hypothetical protein
VADDAYPRPLSRREREWIGWVLPADRPGYGELATEIGRMVVIGEGRRGTGELILAEAGTQVDFSAPLAPVFAYGMIETNFGPISVTVRDILDRQVSVEIVCHRREEVPEEFEESRRWTYSTWDPGQMCPQCGQGLREVPMRSTEGTPRQLVLALCTTDRRLWVFDAASRVNRVIPLTNYYNELMLHKNIRDPRRALDAKQLFAELPSYTDADLARAFATYNALRTKVHVDGTLQAEHAGKPGLLSRIKQLLTGHAS